MYLNLKTYHLVLFLSISCYITGQEMPGVTLGNYSGLNSIQINPSAMHSSKQWLDIHVAGADLFIQNNYLYLSRQEFVFWDIFKAGFLLPSHGEDYGTEVRNFYQYRDSRPKDLFLNLRVNGPGAMVIWGDHAFGIHTAARSVSSIFRLPPELANFFYLGLNYKPQQNIKYVDDKPASMASMSWLEAGLSYAYKVYGRGFNRVDAGISVRKLFGLAGTFVVVDNADYIVYNDSTLQINNLNVQYGISLPLTYNSEPPGYYGDKLVLGGGFGADIGVTYTRLTAPHQKQYFDRLCEQKYEDYLYRAGISLIDVGGIRFRHNATRYAINDKGSYWENLNRFPFSTIDQLMDTISFQFYGDPDATYVNDRFTLWLPSAFSAQFDYHYRDYWYVNASMIVPFQFTKASLRRPAQVLITPRFESRWLEVALPVSLYDWYMMRVGLSVRLYYLTIGTDKLGQFFRLNNFTGMDFYFTIKIPFEKGRCRMRMPNICPASERSRRLN